MTEEQIEKEADNYSNRYRNSMSEGAAAFHAWKAGYHFRDKEVEELKEQLSKANILLIEVNSYMNAEQIIRSKKPPLVP